MANSKYAYVRNFELPDPLLPGTFMLLRVDGHSFHRFSDTHGFAKPNDLRALKLIDHAAKDLMEEYPDIVLGFGESDEYSFLLKKSTSLYTRRHAKLVSTLTSYFTSSYVMHWAEYFPDTRLSYPPSFDGRIVLYPTEKEVKDYFRWRQADTHINNMYNTVFWALVNSGNKTTTEAHKVLKGTYSKDKHEILYSQFGINYNQIDARYRKGSIFVREVIPEVLDHFEGETEEQPVLPDQPSSTPPQQAEGEPPVETLSPTPNAPKEDALPVKKKKSKKIKPRTQIVLLHCDLIKDDFWDERPGLLEE